MCTRGDETEGKGKGRGRISGRLCTERGPSLGLNLMTVKS